jgi:hypothetical protein
MPDESEISRELGIMSGKLDMVLENQRNVISRFEGIEVRIRSLESQRGYVLGVMAAVAFAWTFLFEWVKTKIQIN